MKFVSTGITISHVCIPFKKLKKWKEILIVHQPWLERNLKRHPFINASITMSHIFALHASENYKTNQNKNTRKKINVYFTISFHYIDFSDDNLIVRESSFCSWIWRITTFSEHFLWNKLLLVLMFFLMLIYTKQKTCEEDRKYA